MEDMELVFWMDPGFQPTLPCHTLASPDTSGPLPTLTACPGKVSLYSGRLANRLIALTCDHRGMEEAPWVNLQACPRSFTLGQRRAGPSGREGHLCDLLPHPSSLTMGSVI